MLRFVFGIFILLHGLVHLLYFAHSRRLFELRPEMTWPDNSWALAKLLGVGTTRLLASVTYLITTFGFVIGGIGILTRQAWWSPFVLVSAVVSAVRVILFWDGNFRMLADQGWIGFLINIVLLIALRILG